jgi:hypothetical protein
MLITSLLLLREDVSKLTSVTFSASGAYTQTQVDAWINSSINQYEVERARVAGGYRENRATVTTSPNASPEVETFPGNEIVSLTTLNPLPQVVKGVWVLRDGIRYPLEPMVESDRELQRNSWPAQSGRPTLYEIIELTLGSLAIHFWPPADSAYTLEVIYHPRPIQLVSDSDTWRYVPGTEDAVICDVAMRILERDDEADTAQYQYLAQRKGAAYRTLRMALGQRKRGVMSMRDTRSMQYANQHWWRR